MDYKEFSGMGVPEQNAFLFYEIVSIKKGIWAGNIILVLAVISFFFKG